MIGEENGRVSVKVKVDVETLLDLDTDGINVTMLVGVEDDEVSKVISYDELFKQTVDACTTEEGVVGGWDREFMLEVAQSLRDLSDRLVVAAGAE